LYKNYIFANEPNQGLHIIDNRIPTSPVEVGFIAIPGNQEVAIKEDALYADSYVDLVTLDISDINNIVEVSREEDIFPYNARQNIPRNVSLTSVVDKDRGVVVGYQ